MSKNKGKIFEDDFKKSCEAQGLWVMRLNDTSLSWQKEKTARFTPNNICDFIVYRYPYMFLIENKSTTYKSIGIQRLPTDAKAMIQAHQIFDLSNAGLIEGIIPVFLFNFRNDEDINDNFTYAMRINDFNDFLVESDKKSINRMDVVQHNGIIVNQKIKRVHYTYDIEKMLDEIIEEYKKTN